jgi:hypothetical protein
VNFYDKQKGSTSSRKHTLHELSMKSANVRVLIFFVELTEETSLILSHTEREK